MKWYKKQMDKIKAAQPKSSDEEKKDTVKNTKGYVMDERKKWVTKKKFPNPVAASKLNRPKTDSI
jgi:hypothetical protein